MRLDPQGQWPPSTYIKFLAVLHKTPASFNMSHILFSGHGQHSDVILLMLVCRVLGQYKFYLFDFESCLFLCVRNR